MAIGIDDLDFNDDNYGIQNEGGNNEPYFPNDDNLDPEKGWMDGNNPTGVQQPQTDPVNPDPEPQTEDDIIVSLLKAKGIEDPNKLKFENDEGEIEEVAWDTLSNEEKLNILTSDDSDVNYDLDEEEESFLNYLRTNGITPSEYVEYQKELALEAYRQSLEGGSQYQIDSLSNDDLYILDLQARVKDITDDEALAALEQEKAANPALFEKKMQGIRDEYKAVEDEKVQQEQLLAQQEQAEAFELFQTNVLRALENLEEVGGIKLNLENEDLDEIANFILTSDAAGVSWLGKALDDPDTLVRMAWFALKGDEAFESITDYYDKEITKRERSAYDKGYEDAKKGVQPTNQKPRVAIKPAPKPGEGDKPVEPTGKTIDDLD